MENSNRYLYPHTFSNQINKGKIIWMYGLSGSGKSTLAKYTSNILNKHGHTTYILDGDNLRFGLNNDLGFSDQDRHENLRRAAEVAKIMSNVVEYVICTFITPFNTTRKHIKTLMTEYDFLDIYLKASLATCEKRDIKGLYRKARIGKIENFTGISSPFDLPDLKSAIIDTQNKSIEESSKDLLNLLNIKLE